MDAIDVYTAVTEDKTTWGEGPWQSEPDRKLWRDPSTGLHCLAHRNMMFGHWCAYVAVPPGHPAHGKEYDAIDIEVHGGLTYGAECQGHICHIPPKGEPDNVWWLGFDCGHCCDVSPASAKRDALRGWTFSFDRESSYRTLSYVEEECARLAKQLVKMQETSERAQYPQRREIDFEGPV